MDKSYSEALEAAKKFKESFTIGKSYRAKDIREVFNTIFPELKESEDEKIRNTLIRFFKDNYSNEAGLYDGEVTVGKALAWLDKQKNVEWGEEDEATLADIISDIRALQSSCSPSESNYAIYHEEIDWLKSLKPRHHWKPTQYQLSNLRYIIDYCKDDYFKNTLESLEGLYVDLKKL